MLTMVTNPPDQPVAGDPIDELRDLAARLAVEAGSIALEGRASTSGLTGTTKSTQTDMVTEFDRAAEAHIVAELQRVRPDDAIVGEEGTDEAGTSGVAWFVDPIDGTTNFVYDLPAWTCSIGVSLGGTMVAGAVNAPALGELYVARRGGGATRNGSPISVSEESDVSLALVGTGFTYDADARAAQARAVAELIAHVRDIRRLGSAAFDLCMVACGRLDVYFERYLNPWDAAAGTLIASEAGAVVSDFSGGTGRPEELLVATPAVHDQFVRLLLSAAT
jgi:myo-inositol-1(or 4)-monophosphatase